VAKSGTPNFPTMNEGNEMVVGGLVLADLTNGALASDDADADGEGKIACPVILILPALLY
jgi:hypothetical protein